jgi:hypothetical protein
MEMSKMFVNVPPPRPLASTPEELTAQLQGILDCALHGVDTPQVRMRLQADILSVLEPHRGGMAASNLRVEITGEPGAPFFKIIDVDAEIRDQQEWDAKVAALEAELDAIPPLKVYDDTVETADEVLARLGTDPRKWAEECVPYLCTEHGYEENDIKTLTTWFANAIAQGRKS